MTSKDVPTALLLWSMMAASMLVVAGLAAEPVPKSDTGAATAAAPAEPRMLAPTLGRPEFVQPGGNLNVVAVIPDADIVPTVELVSTRFPPRRYTLTTGAGVGGRLRQGLPIAVRVPQDMPAATYDLELSCGGVRLSAPHCVAVGSVPARVRLVHLSDMNIGELGAPGFDERLISEINLVAPTLVLATGDFLDLTCEDREGGWQRVVDFFTRLDAPALIACGDHDDLSQYCRWIAPSPVGEISVGPLRGVVLYDSPSRPIGGDAEQVTWFERTLAVPNETRSTFVLSPDECPNLLRVWQNRGVLSQMVQATRLGAWFAGGSRDWDGVEYRVLIDAAAPMLYVRTHESSTATRGGASGVSHFRIVDLEGERAWLPGALADETNPPSLPVGRLRLSFNDPNDGTQDRVSFTAVNSHDCRLDRLGARVVLRRSGPTPPWCLGAELVQAVDLGEYWDCRVAFDLPDRGALRAVVGTGPPPRQPDIEVVFDATAQLPLMRQVGKDGLSYVTSRGAIVLVHLRNRGTTPADFSPLIRLDGQTLGYVVLDEPGPTATAYRLRLGAGRTLTLHVDLTAARVTPGRRELQVYLKGGEAWWPACYPLEVTIEE
ncbi:MAG: hypothetical protein PVJ57_02400 [Phycisphaerae bacterium]|jgi:hypothetical protein